MVTYDRREALAEEWNGADPRSDAEIQSFYQTTERLMPDLDEWHSEPFRQDWTRALVQALHDEHVTVLDIGAGGGHDLDALVADGHRPEYMAAVEPNDEARQSLNRRGYFTQPTIEYLGSAQRCDAVICVDVLEHLPDPKAMIDQIARLIPVGGRFFEATGTQDILMPLHLKSNWGWAPDGQLRGLGFTLEAEVGRFHIWRRTELKKTALTQSALMNIWRQIDPRVYDCVLHLILGKPGWQFRRENGDGLISRARSVVMSSWFRETADDVFLMLDDDILFEPWQAEQLVQHCRDAYPIIAGAYVKADKKSPALKFYPGTTVKFGPDEPVAEIRWAATGFMAVRREVIETLIATMPVCHPSEDYRFWPLAMPFVKDSEYLSEDYAFCERARQAGFGVYLDPTLKIGHIKPETLTLDDMARSYGGNSWEGIYAETPEMPDVLKTGEWRG